MAMREALDTALEAYVEEQVLPRYGAGDPAHGIAHVRQVLGNSRELAALLDVEWRMVYVIAAYHDIGIPAKGREDHEKTSAQILREDAALARWFTPEEVEVMAQAVEDHRASTGREPRSLYGRIVSEADRDIDPERIVRRCMEYGKSRFPEKDTAWQVGRAVEHIREKYGPQGYVKLWLHSSRNQEGLDTLRRWLATGELEEVCKRYARDMRDTLYVSDLDGTLLTPQKQLSPFTVRVLNRLAEQGVHFTYATARSRYSAEEVTAGLTKNLPVIVYNGVFVIDGATGERLVESTFPTEQLSQVRAWGEACGLRPLCYAFVEGRERVSWREDLVNEGMAFYLSNRKWDSRLRPVGEDDALYQGEVFYFTYIGEWEELEPLWELARECPWLNATFQQELYRQEYWLELMPRAATKANASRLLLERLGCSRMVGFGDAVNDLPLLRAADWGCAVENAVPSLLEEADEVLPANTRDGVARFLLADTAPALALGERAGEFRLRLYRPSDLEELIRLFYETVHRVNLGDYSQQEVDAWVPSLESVDREAWGKSLRDHYTLVAERDGALVGFGDMDDTGYLDRLYVHKDFQGRGAATALVHAFEGYARGLGVPRVTVHASRTARPFFEARGYGVEYAQQVERRGVLLENFGMELSLEEPRDGERRR